MEAACHLSLSRHDVDGALVPGLSSSCESLLSVSSLRKFEATCSNFSVFTCYIHREYFNRGTLSVVHLWLWLHGKFPLEKFTFSESVLSKAKCVHLSSWWTFILARFLMIPLSKVWQFFRKVSRETNLCCTYFNLIQVSLSPLQQKSCDNYFSKNVIN